MSNEQRHLYVFGPFTLDASERQLSRGGAPVPVPPKSLEALIVLVQHQGRLVGKDELMKTLWPESFVEEANLNHHVWALRKTLGEGEGGRRYIETVPRRGYRFVAEVTGPPDDDEVVLEKHSFTRVVCEETEDAGVAEAEAAHAGLENVRSAGEQEEAPPHGGGPALVRGDGHLSVGAPHTLGSRRPSRRGVTLLAVALSIGGAAAFGLYLFVSQRQPGGRAAAVPFREMSISRVTTSGKTTHAAISPDGKYVAHVTRDEEGDSLWVRHVAAPGGVRIAGPAATEYVSVTFAPDGDLVYYLTLDRDKGHTKLYRVPVLGGPSSVAADNVGPIGFSPDGKRMAFIRTYGGESRLVVAGADGANERVLALRRKPEFFRVDWNAPAWSPDGKIIACQARLSDEKGQYETVVGVAVADGSQTPLTPERWYLVGPPVWLPDGRGLLVAASGSATDPTQVWRVVLPGGEAARVTQDLNDYCDLSLTADGSRLAAVQNNTVSGIWIAPGSDAGRVKRVTSEVGWIQEIARTPDGRIVYRSNVGGSAEVWVIEADGSNPKQLTAGARVNRGLAVSPDGRHIFFASARAGHSNIWRVDADGTNLRRLTDGDGDLYPDCTPDGRWVVFQRGESDPRLWRVPADGGEAVQLTETRAYRPAVSPDGNLIAYHYLDPNAERLRWRIGVISSDGGRPLKQFDLPPTSTWRFVRWSPDGQSIAYVNNPGGLSDIWLQPLDGGPPRPLTAFGAEQIIAFDWSRDGRSFALVRAAETSDVVLIGDATSK